MQFLSCTRCVQVITATITWVTLGNVRIPNFLTMAVSSVWQGCVWECSYSHKLSLYLGSRGENIWKRRWQKKYNHHFISSVTVQRTTDYWNNFIGYKWYKAFWPRWPGRLWVLFDVHVTGRILTGGDEAQEAFYKNALQVLWRSRMRGAVKGCVRGLPWWSSG